MLCQHPWEVSFPYNDCQSEPDLQQDSIHHRRLEALEILVMHFRVSSSDRSTAAQSLRFNYCIVAVTYSHAACLVGDRVSNYAIPSNELRRLNPRIDIATHSLFVFPIVFVEKVTDDVQPAPFLRLRPAGSLGGPE
jgi:hypothetical protein